LVEVFEHALDKSNYLVGMIHFYISFAERINGRWDFEHRRTFVTDQADATFLVLFDTIEAVFEQFRDFDHVPISSSLVGRPYRLSGRPSLPRLSFVAACND
jgi:hypothetical protein